ncbi:hypothetical protein BS47DRAFT_1360174 [Hydnum rufescens UP504]|uniref:Uncharacterized protein n=1 Tax=Hydnum rufescens UP504 TaxID=1448309 RepID=A0A9P6B2Y1_9AGAM|nr:hypothetical protein BS47DRAFT_1360174 [Hydnum rufescens UP504]
MWGLSDGEGCEHFWSDLQKLIPGLHATGHHHHLFILDHQAEHILETKHEGMGRWLCDQVHQADEQLGEALMAVGKHPHGLDVEGLLVQFNEQWEFQTKSINHEAIKNKGNMNRLANLKKEKWINLQLNIHVLHDQLITKLHAHKFELANLEHAHASQVMDQKTKSHVEKAVKQHAPGIKATVHKYNAKWKEMLKERSKVVKKSFANVMLSIQTFALGLLRNMKQSTTYSSSAMVMKTWECSLATITIPVGTVDWSQISMPPPVNHPWTCRKALQGIPQLGERDEDGDTSSDDDDGVELELVAELEDVRFLGDLDHLIGEGDWSEGEGQDNVMVDL